MKILTCTPVRFKGDASFFERETGSYCRGLQKAGIESQAVMPGPSMEDDDSDVIRVSYEKLESPTWWQQQGADGVLLYAWGLPKFTPIVSAINASGTKVITHLDSCGLFSPSISPFSYFRSIFQRYIATRGCLLGTLVAFLASIKARIPQLSDIPRIKHLERADFIGVLNPVASRMIHRFLIHYGREDLTTRLRVLPHPILNKYVYDGRPKENVVLSVARWCPADWAQKDPITLLKALNIFLSERIDYKVIIIGRYDISLERLRQRFCPNTASRITLSGHQTSDNLLQNFCKAKISVSSSTRESFQTAMGQHLCCGGSVVSRPGLPLSVFYYYSSRSSGRVSIEYSAPSLADALLLEAQSWDQGHRDASYISRAWIPDLHLNHAVRNVVNYLQSI